ncbi:dihydrolipoamide acetyltransferase family protein [Rhodococcus sp. LB1]|uniref:dihydrolipoamide acetyltransferase family protein n=1 Tax=Rhodococcus sp. LB1 TaxID=1807499 RepID=UPI00077A98D4|nr:dihydrolipoamide acetyltransferase family protein [Rhodococcus sp. LB1]KXX54127.1 branched-chain alpha-keto acid dehydrogenase subunit E2 [Rhodococcus sp. LB1]
MSTSILPDSTTTPQGNLFHLPDVGEGLTEAEVVTWHKAVGDTVAINDIVVEIETAKSLVELPSPFAGTVIALLVEEGQTVPVGSPLLAVDSGLDRADPAPEPETSRPSVLVGYGPSDRSTQRRRKRNTEVSGCDSTPTPPAPTAAPVRTTPLVRKIAKDKGIELHELVGTGPNGRITRGDVLRHEQSTESPADTAAAGTAAPSAPASDTSREERIPVRGVRKHTAQAMVRSAFTAPHVTEFITVDMTATMELLARLKASPAFDGVKLTPLTLVARALIVALRRNPSLNSAWDDAADEIVLKKYVNLGIAAATPRGLVVPNIKDANHMSLQELAAALEQLTATVREGKSSPADLSGGTITITNVGVFGVDTGTPILNPGEAAILCFGAVRKQPWVIDDAITIRSITTLGLSFDHRLVDGQQGSQLLYDLSRILEDPLNLIAFG